MATLIQKRAGAPAGTIVLTMPSGNSYTVDDSANSTISVSNAADALDLGRHIYLQVSGTPAAPYVKIPDPLGGGAELAYSESTVQFTQAETTGNSYLVPGHT